MTLLLLVRLMVSCLLLECRKARAFAAPAHLAARLEQWLAHCGSTRRGIRLAGSAEINAPIAAGPRCPSILIPAKLFDELEESELDQIGLHEAAHLARGDDYAVIFQRLLEAVFALHPVVRWITRRIDLEREIACDDFVVEATGRPRPYAACLTRVVELTGGVRASLAASSAIEERSHLARRVEMLLDKTHHTGTRLMKARLTAMVVALATLACVAAMTPVLVVFAIPRSQTFEGASVLKIPKPQQALPAAQHQTARALEAPQRPPLPAQTPPAQTPAPVNQPADITPFLVPVEVRDPRSRFVTGLDRENFKLIEDGVYQEISQFWSEGAPLSVGVVFDVSDGIGGKLERKQQAVAQLMKNGNPEDEFFLVQFSDRGEKRSGNFLAAGITPNIQEIHNRLSFLQLKGRTTLLDGVSMAMNHVKYARNPRKAIVIICDAGDDSVRYTESQVKNTVRATYVPIYAIGIFEALASRGPAPEEMSFPAVLNEITDETGGRHLAVDSLADLPDAAFKIGVELRNSYVLGFSPKNTARDGTYRRVEVKLVQPGSLPPLKAIYRTGYFAPTQ